MENMKTTLEGTKGAQQKKQKASASYTIRAFGQNVIKLIELELIDKKDAEELVKIRERVAKEYVRKELGL